MCWSTLNIIFGNNCLVLMVFYRAGDRGGEPGENGPFCGAVLDWKSG